MHLNSRSLGRFCQIGVVLLSVTVSAAAQVPTSDPSSSPPITPTHQVPSADSSASPSPTPAPQAPTDESSPKPATTSMHAIKPATSLERRFFGNVLRDQGAIFTSPLRLQGSDVKFLLPLTLTTGGLIATDRRTANKLIANGGSPDRVRISNNIARIGAFYGVSSIASSMYLFGRVTHNDRLRETGLLGAEAVIDGGLVVTVLKTATQRTRPNSDNGRGDFFDGGSSFPSGHSTVSWALASIVAHEYKDNRLISFGAYGVAALVGVSRFTGRNHFLSDVLVGSAIGYGIGRYVYRQHHDPSLDTPENNAASVTTNGVTGSRLFPVITPRYNRAANSYGLRLTWGL